MSLGSQRPADPIVTALRLALREISAKRALEHPDPRAKVCLVEPPKRGQAA